MLRLKKQFERVAAAVETFETEFVSLARESRAAVTRVRDLSDRVHNVVGVVGDLVLPPVMAINTTSRVDSDRGHDLRTFSLGTDRSRVRAGRRP